ncbi:ergosterol biosynthesis ERG4/ERG24 family-domain-containing protein [Dactylonectria macrodidyma]|uniref:7-dehydrocholesterol reductase n=1 Tax=Dactylonectria macrodidyma TaxID=307937 RepID=A0A9P9JSB1_9HYPO|nr:ergosterol biosynthesis ERG4/ERG24 family-domain-containing protein [Dactylonectria macrodidyma]
MPPCIIKLRHGLRMTIINPPGRSIPLTPIFQATDAEASNAGTVWGRTGLERAWLGTLVAASPCFLAPLTSICVFITLAQYEGSFAQFGEAALEEGFWSLCVQYGPQLTFKGILAVVCWIGMQALLFRYLPGEMQNGQYTPAGYLLSYKINGLYAWVVTHIFLAGLCYFGILDPGFIPRNWSSLIGAMNLAGISISALAFIKAHFTPTHAEDRKFSASWIYDFYMGIELNPRLGDSFDLKLFSNGRPGMVAWTLIDISNMAYQYQTQQHVEPSLILITILQTLYVVDFFVNESWYLRTIDIAHDHYGFYLAWGCFCFLPTTYTIQGQYLGLYPRSASTTYLGLWFAVGLVGYVLFRSANDQKDKVRRSGGKCLIWGKPAEFIVASYKTSDGKQHESLLLCCGWWGLSRHCNYVGDLFLSYSTCALVGSTHVVVWIYAIWMTMLLVHRCMRDEKRCSDKYGPAWTEYCKRVPWRFIQGVW